MKNRAAERLPLEKQAICARMNYYKLHMKCRGFLPRGEAYVLSCALRGRYIAHGHKRFMMKMER